MKKLTFKILVLTPVFLLLAWNTLAQDWNQIIKTAATDRGTLGASRSAEDTYGNAVAVDGNYAVVGAQYSSIIGFESGTAYILYNNAGTWQTVKQLNSTDLSANDCFGVYVAISGNYVIIGAYKEDHDALGANALSDAGSAYIFAKDQGGTDNWGQVKKIVPTDRAAGNWFGSAVCISGNQVIVGARQDDQDASGVNTLSDAGSAYIFSKDQGGIDNWGQVKKIVASDRAANDQFGVAVSISGNRLVVGAFKDDEDEAGANTLSDAGSAYIFAKDQGGTNNWGQVKKIVSSDRAAGDAFSLSLSISGDYAIVGAYQEDHDVLGANELAEAGSAYIFAKDHGGIDNWGEVKKIVPSDRAANDWFGVNVSISGNHVIVGARYEDEDALGANSLAEAGSAYIFAKDQDGTDNWGQVKKIVSSDRAAGDVFGVVVSISGNNVIVGAYQEDEDATGLNPMTDAGSAYYFSKDQGGTDNWGQTSKTVAVGTKIISNNSGYGYSVAIDGNYAIVGAYQEDKNTSGTNVLTNAGAAYILKYNGTAWSEIKKIVPSDRAAGDKFGSAVSISGNYVIVGTYLEDHDASGANMLSDAGSAYIFSKDQGGTDNWGQVKKIVPSDRATTDYFGYSVSISGNYVIVGAYQEDHDRLGANPLSNAGSAYIFSKDQGGSDNWGQVKKIVSSDRAATDYFGYAVSISGNSVIVGAYLEDHDAAGANMMTDAGSAYIFSKDQGGTDNWGQVKKIVPSDRAASDNFGFAVSISGNSVIVGAYLEDQDALGANTLTEAGSAYIFSKDQGGTDNWGQVKKIIPLDRAASDRFGYAVSISGNSVIVGAYLDDQDSLGANTLTEAGSAYIFAKDQGGTDNWGQIKKTVPSDREANDRFGYAVSISGTTAIAGAYFEDHDASGAYALTDVGSAYFFGNTPEINVAQGITPIANGTGTYNFGSQSLSTNTDIIFTIQNTGLAASALGSFTITGTHADQFSIQGTNPVIVDAEETTTFTVRLTPTSLGVKTASLSFANQDADENPYTFTLTGTCIKISQNITFNALASKTYGDANFTISATGGASGNPVVFTSGDATIATCSGTNGATVSIKKTGAVKIYANQTGNDNYNAATQAEQTLTISAFPITVTANTNQTKVYGSSNPTYTYTNSTALFSGDVFTGALSRTAGENVGNYPINLGTLSAGTNYAITFVSNDFSITTKAITVTADASQTKVYGSANPTYTYTNSPVLSSGDVFTGSLSRTVGENVGNFAIALGTLSAGNNYAINFVSKDFSITPKELLITGISASDKTYDGTTPATLSGGVLSGVVAGDIVTLNLGTGEFADKNVGNGIAITLSATLSGTSATNYTFIQPGNLTASITARPIEIKADQGQSKIFGTVDPEFTYTISNGNLVSGDELSGALTRIAGEAVGLYALQIGTLSGGNNYSLTFIPANFSITSATGVDSDDVNAIKIYSHKKSIFISIPSIEGKAKLAIYNVNGDLVFNSENLTTTLERFDLNVIAGIYIAKVTNGNKIYNKKIIIE